MHSVRSQMMAALVVCVSALALTYGPLGLAASQAVILRRIKSSGKGGQRACQYDSAGEALLQDHCAFASVLYAMGEARPSLQEVHILRGPTKQLWERERKKLGSTAEGMGMNMETYLHEITRSLWGGVPDILLIAKAAGLNVAIHDGTGRTLGEHKQNSRVQDGRQMAILTWHGRHYTVKKAEAAFHRRQVLRAGCAE